MSPQVRVGVGVFVWKDGRFIMGQRRGSHGSGTWSVPGGHLEFTETWQACAVREVGEETGMKITNVRFLAATNDIFQADARHYVTIWLESDWLSGKPVVREPEKFVRLEWIDPDQLPVPLFEPGWQNLRQSQPELFLKKRAP